MSEPAGSEVKETNNPWRDCCTRMCLPAASSNIAVGIEQALCGASCPDNQHQFVGGGGDNGSRMVVCPRVVEYLRSTRAWTAR